MSWIAVGVAGASMVMQAQGASKSAAAAKKQAKAIQKAKEFEAVQLEINAGNTIAASQRVAAERQRQARLVQSRALAVAAAGGGGVGENDTSFMKLMADIHGRGAYDSAVALYDGEERARTMRAQAQAKRYEGKLGIMSGDASADAAYMKGASGILSTGGSLFAKYGGSGPSGDSALIGEMVPGQFSLSNPAYG